MNIINERASKNNIIIIPKKTTVFLKHYTENKETYLVRRVTVARSNGHLNMYDQKKRPERIM